MGHCVVGFIPNHKNVSSSVINTVSNSLPLKHYLDLDAFSNSHKELSKFKTSIRNVNNGKVTLNVSRLLVPEKLGF